MNWSGGKDSALCLYESRRHGPAPEALVTTVSAASGRVSMHGVHGSLIAQQAASVQLPLHLLPLEGTGMQAYEEAIGQANRSFRARGFTHALSGDLFLEDLKVYREGLYARDGLAAALPLWKKDTATLLRDFISLGFKAIVVCTNESLLDKSFCGRLLDESFLNDLPAQVDACGEHGEYHSFVFDGPGFREPVRFCTGELVRRSYPAPLQPGNDCFTDPQPAAGFYFCDLLPA